MKSTEEKLKSLAGDQFGMQSYIQVTIDQIFFASGEMTLTEEKVGEMALQCLNKEILMDVEMTHLSLEYNKTYIAEMVKENSFTIEEIQPYVQPALDFLLRVRSIRLVNDSLVPMYSSIDY